MEHIPLNNLTAGQIYRGTWRVQNFTKTIDRSGHPMVRFDLSDQYGCMRITRMKSFFSLWIVAISLILCASYAKNTGTNT
ncbi:hypothetical protein IM774_03340 [Erysipelotrichaceae bacterium RD49]|nr:hypothetical protein [Erysipelotrichaceae bacterium RD49]